VLTPFNHFSAITRAIIVAAVLWLPVCPAGAQQQRTSNLVSGSASAMGTGATTIIAAPSGPRRLYISSVACGRTDAGTSAISVTFNDDVSTVMVLMNTGGGTSTNMVFPFPLTVPAATAFKFTASGSVSAVFCSAAGFTGD
jgi:hypothetical protein